MRSRIGDIYALEQLSGGNTCIHRLHPAAKLLTTMVFIVTVMSFDRYALGRLAPYLFYPSLLMALSETPYTMLFKRLAVALPFCLFAGLANLWHDRALAFSLGALSVHYGQVSLLVLVFRVYLCVMAVLLLVSVTPFAEITKTLRWLRLPLIFVVIMEMTYRYIGILIDEAYGMYTAYALRRTRGKGVDARDMGSFIGQLLLRSLDRAERVYHAMLCRGYTLRLGRQGDRAWGRGDFLYGALICALCLAFRFFDIQPVIAGLFGGR